MPGDMSAGKLKPGPYNVGMTREEVTIYLPNGETINLQRAKNRIDVINGVLTVRPDSSADVTMHGSKIVTTLPFLIQKHR
jgi:hypothetical protein